METIDLSKFEPQETLNHTSKGNQLKWKCGDIVQLSNVKIVNKCLSNEEMHFCRTEFKNVLKLK